MSMSSINTTLAPRSTSVLLREARWFDLAALTDIAVAAFTNSPLYNHFSPLHSKYPSTFRRFLRNELEHRLTAPGQVVIVAELVLSSAEHPKIGKGATPSAIIIVGYSVWISKRKDVAPNAIWNPDTVLKSIPSLQTYCIILTLHRMPSRLASARKAHNILLLERLYHCIRYY